VNHRWYRVEHTISTISHDQSATPGDTITADELVLLIECDRPQAGSSRHRLNDIDEIVIGRGVERSVERNDGRLVVRVPDGRVSTTHAYIRRHEGAFFIQDAGAKNGTVVNGVRVESQILRDRDIVECGRTFFSFRLARRRPVNEPADLELAPSGAAIPGQMTFHEGLAAQLRALQDVARSSLPVLILGPSGTGKELIARGVHALSGRAGSFVGVNCGALPENLVEAELFGARRGAFTGANEDRPGLVRTSDQGTLFLDEIGDLPLRAQPTLLRTLQEREVLPVGSTRPISVDLRLIAATHHDLGLLADKQQFRDDLLARISGFVVRLPPLRERIDDIGLLIAVLLERHRGRDQAPTTLSVEAMRLLLRYDWPLNVRELEHCLRAALALSDGRIDGTHLPDAIRNPAPSPTSLAPPSRPTRVFSAEQEAIRDRVRALLTEHRGNISQVARVMGKDRVQIRRWIRLFGLSADDGG
jgi:sigma-54 dependent transcriptional regulator, acetoin dehydrogenase operon transcriptional activator AcoR